MSSLVSVFTLDIVPLSAIILITTGIVGLIAMAVVLLFTYKETR